MAGQEGDTREMAGAGGWSSAAGPRAGSIKVRRSWGWVASAQMFASRKIAGIAWKSLGDVPK